METVGTAVKKALEEKGHEILPVGRQSDNYQVDISSPESLKAPFIRIGSFDDVGAGPSAGSVTVYWGRRTRLRRHKTSGKEGRRTSEPIRW
jgi:hypothetical protein